VTQVYDSAGVLQQVTVVQAGPCRVLQVKTADRDGYNAVQLGYGEAKASRTTLPEIGHAAKAGAKPAKFVREVRLQAAADLEAGQQVTVELFDGVYAVDVVGQSKGKGHAGAMKRWHFAGQPMSHGTERKHRSPGSQSGYGTNRGFGGDIKRGKKMTGHMGDDRVTSRNHRIIKIDKDNNLLLVKGSVPGAKGGFVYVRASKKLAPQPKAPAATKKGAAVKKK
jgi:large subunit ribosomal protein L3